MCNIDMPQNGVCNRNRLDDFYLELFFYIPKRVPNIIFAFHQFFNKSRYFFRLN